MDIIGNLQKEERGSRYLKIIFRRFVQTKSLEPLPYIDAKIFLNSLQILYK